MPRSERVGRLACRVVSASELALALALVLGAAVSVHDATDGLDKRSGHGSSPTSDTRKWKEARSEKQEERGRKLDVDEA